MDRPEAAGLGVALAAHGALIAALSVGLAGARLPPLQREPIEISFVEDVGIVSAASEPAAEAPAPSIAPETGVPEEAAAEPARAVEVPRPAPTPGIAPPRPTARTVPAKAQPNRAPAPSGAAKATRGSRLGADFLKGLGRDQTPSQSQAAPAATIGAAARSSLGAEVRRQLKPHWKAPTGADAELLRTELSVSLARDGGVERVEVVGTSGQTASNRPQVKLHQEQAIRAVRLAAPFRLPAEFYDAWKVIRPAFDRRLSQ